MTELTQANEALTTEFADKDATIADKDSTITELSVEIARLKALLAANNIENKNNFQLPQGSVAK